MARCGVELNLDMQLEVRDLAQQLGSREAAVTFIQNQLKHQKRTLIKEVNAQRNILSDLADMEANGIKDPFQFILVDDTKGRVKKPSISQESKTIIKDAQIKIIEIITALKPKWHGGKSKNVTLSRNIAKEMAGEETGDAIAKQGAKQIGEVLESLRLRFNKAGGDIGKLENYGLPQSWNQFLVRKVSKEEFVSDVKAGLDIERIRRDNPSISIDEALDFIYDQVVNGRRPRAKSLSRLDQSTAKLSDTRRSSRFLKFINEDAQFSLMEKYGNFQGDTAGTVLSHIERMGGDIARMERLGPDPENLVKVLDDAGKINLDARAAGTAKLASIGEVWKVVTGEVNEIGSASVAKWASAARNIMAFTQLGAAAVASITDIGTAGIVSKQRGFGSFGGINKAFKSMSPTDAAHLGIILETTTSRSGALARFSGDADDIAAGITARAAELTVRATGLSAWTSRMKYGFQLNASNKVALQAGKTFDELPSRMRRTLEEYGISSKEWDEMRRFTETVDGNVYMAYQKMPDGVVRDKWLNILETEVEYAVPTPDARIRAITNQGEKRGTLKGELARFAGQYKAFPLVILGRVLPKLNQKGDKGLMLGYLATTTLLGFAALELKQIAAGKEPINPADLDGWQLSKLMTLSMMQGGGSGFFGDLFLSSFGADGYQSDTLSDILGPVAGDLDQLTRILYSNVSDAISGDDTSWLPDVSGYIQKKIPLSNWWYTKMWFNALWDEFIQSELDPDFKKKLRRNKKKIKEQFEQDYLFK